MAHPTVKPVRIVYYNDGLNVRTLHGIGHAGSCPCGWEGPRRSSRLVAREDARIHAATCTGNETV